MSILDLIKSRRSIQSYKDIPLTKEQWTTLLHAAAFAPNVGNIQDWRFIAVTKKETRVKIAHASHNQAWMAGAPLHIVCCSDTDRVKKLFGKRGEMLYSIQNVAAAIQNMLLVAQDMGLGTCWIGSFEENEIQSVLEIPENVRVHAIITVGYANEIKPTPQKQSLRAYCYIDSWDNVTDADEQLIHGYKYAELTKKKSKESVSFFDSIITQITKYFKK